MQTTKSQRAGERTHKAIGPLGSLAESILIQMDGDLANKPKELLAYIRKMAQAEIDRGPMLPPLMTIETALEHVEAVKSLCSEIEADYETAMDDPENNVEGWHPTDKANEFLQRSSLNERAARNLIIIGMGIV